MLKNLYRFLLRFFLKLHGFAYVKASAAAIKYYGFHPKHRFEDFHRFFLDNIQVGAKVLDVGCSRGELTVDLATKASRVIACDISKESIDFAKKHNARENIRYFVGDAILDMPKERFDVVICSNLLEHLSAPRKYLEELHAITKRILVRVPNANGNWIMGVKRDLGMNYFLDPQHHKEYTPDSIKEELEESGWQIELVEVSSEIMIAAKEKGRADAK